MFAFIFIPNITWALFNSHHIPAVCAVNTHTVLGKVIIWSLALVSFMVFRFILPVWKSHNESKSKRCPICWLTSQITTKAEVKAWLKPGVWNSIQIFHGRCRGTSTLAIHCCFLRFIGKELCWKWWWSTAILSYTCACIITIVPQRVTGMLILETRHQHCCVAGITYHLCTQHLIQRQWL